MKVGNACGFWGDDRDAPKRMLEQQPDLDYLTLDYLAEVSLSIMAIQKEKNSLLGYARDFLYVMQSLIPYWKAGGRCKIITNGGGLNPQGLAAECQKILDEAKLNLKIGVVTGDDVLNILQQDPKNPLYAHMETNESFDSRKGQFVTANAYLGAQPIRCALELGADIVLAGRIADPSLTVGPAIYHYRWAHDAYDQIAGATIAGHLIECGTQVTGGISTDWLTVPDPENMGYPIAEIFENGSCMITKPENTGGRVSCRTVKEQLLYEIGDPSSYKSPDATVSFLELNVKEAGKDRVLVEGARGLPPPYSLKVSATYRAGYRTEGTLAFFGDDVYEKAKRAGEIIFAQVASKVHLDKTWMELFGGQPKDGACLLRLAALAEEKEALELFVKHIAPLVTSGPQGTTGYISGRAEVRPVFGFWPCLIENNLLKVNII